MTLDRTTPNHLDSDGRGSRRAQPRRALLALVAIGLAAQAIIAGVALAEPVASRYGWQMYAAVPYVPSAWASSDGAEERLDLARLVVHPRIEIDYVALVQEHGCELSGADAIRFELADGSQETISCR